MMDFDFISPTKIYFGTNKEELIGQICSERGYKRVYIIIGQGSVKRSGLLDTVLKSLDENDIKYQILEGVRPNPTIDLCHKGIEEARAFAPNLILAIGGGSVVDTAKNIAVGYFYVGDSFDFNLHKVKPKKALPIGVILTIAASGSELSTSCVIQDDKTQIKQGFNDDIVRPVFAIENPKLTYSVSKVQTAYGVVDIMMHTLERYFNASSDNEPADGFAEALLRSVIKAARTVVNNPTDYDARAVLMLMSSLSHNGLTSIGKNGSFFIHPIEHALSGVYPHVAHAAGLAVLFPAWAKYYVSLDVDKFDSLAKNVFDLHNKNKIENAKAGINEIEKLFAILGMPKTFKDLGIDNPDIEKLVNIITDNGGRVIKHPKKDLDKEVLTAILKSCL